MRSQLREHASGVGLVLLQSSEAMREKACFVLKPWSSAWRLGFGWADVTATRAYTVFDIHPLMAAEFVRRGAISGRLTWHFARPPVQGLDFEMDVRGSPTN